MSVDGSFTALADYWLENMDVEGQLSRTPHLLYERAMRTLEGHNAP